MSNTGQSYQKYDGASGTYQSLSSNNGSLENPRRGREKWAIGAVALAIVAIVFVVTNPRSNPKDAIDKTIKSSSNIAVKANGKLELFDDLSE